MLSDKIDYYKETKHKLNNTPAQYKKQFEWLKEVDSLALANAQLNLQTAYNTFFTRPEVGFPKFKSKKSRYYSYTTNNQKGTIKISDRYPFREVNALQEVGNANGDIGTAVGKCVILCNLYCNGVDVIGVAPLCAKLRRTDGEDARAGTNVKKAHIFKGLVLHKTDNESCGLVSSGAECHTGVHLDDDLAVLCLVFLPRGDDCHLAERDGLVILLPAFRPVILVHALALDGGVDAKCRKALNDVCTVFAKVFLLGNEKRYLYGVLVCVKNGFVDELSVHTVKAEVGVVLNHKSVVKHAHHGCDGVKVAGVSHDGKFCPVSCHCYLFLPFGVVGVGCAFVGIGGLALTAGTS